MNGGRWDARRKRGKKQGWMKISICWNAITNVDDEDDQLNVTTTMIIFR
jgi:hypothetical protein